MDVYLRASVVQFLDRLNLGRVGLLSDNGPTVIALKEAVKKDRVGKETDLREGTLRDSQPCGLAESNLRQWQIKARTLRFDVESRYGCTRTPDKVVWPWIVKHGAFLVDKYRIRGDGTTSHQAA